MSLTLRQEKTLFAKAGGRLDSATELGKPVFQAVFPPQCKEKLPRSLPPQYALELLTVYAWERAGQKEDFSTAQGFQTVLELVTNYQQLCIYWTRYYDINHPEIGPYLRRQLSKPRYSAPQSLAPPPRMQGPGAQLWYLGNEEGEAPRLLVICCCQSQCWAPYCRLTRPQAGTVLPPSASR